MKTRGQPFQGLWDVNTPPLHLNAADLAPSQPGREVRNEC